MFIVEMLTKLKPGNSIKNAQQQDDNGKQVIECPVNKIHQSVKYV